MSDFYYDQHFAVKNSTSLTDVWYGSSEKTLFVKFKSTGSVAGYKNVPESVVREFGTYINHPYRSAGQYYARYIKPRYQGVNGDVNLRHVSERRVSGEEKLRFTITGFAPVSVTVDATSMEEAVALFRQANPGAKVSKAEVTFA